MAFTRQLPVYSPLPLRAVAAALGGGDPRAALAAALQARYGSTEALLTASGTAALTLALRAARAHHPGLPVAMPGYACYDLISAAIGAEVPVALYDLDPATLAPDPASLAAALDGGAAALVAVHLFGVPVPLDAMRRAAESAGALLIEDAAQATGGSWGAQPLGAHGDFGILSFGRGKGETGGGGGALLVRDAVEIPAAVRRQLEGPRGNALSFAGKLAAQWALGRPSLYAIPASIPMLKLGEAIYREPAPTCAMGAAPARVLGVTRVASQAEASRRRSNVEAYVEALGAAYARHGVRPADGGEPGWLRFPLRGPISQRLVRAGTALGLAGAYPLPLRALPASARILVRSQPTPQADALAAGLRTLPTHGMLGGAVRRRIERWLAALAAETPR